MTEITHYYVTDDPEDWSGGVRYDDETDADDHAQNEGMTVVMVRFTIVEGPSTIADYRSSND